MTGTTISKEVSDKGTYIGYFSLAKNTDISPEIYPYYKLIIISGGRADIYDENGEEKSLGEGEAFISPLNKPIGIKTDESVVYTEIHIRKDSKMNDLIKPGEIFKLKDLVPYQEGKIINMDLVHNEKMKFVVMSFDEDTKLSEHAAPGEALIFALDGKAVISYEGEDHTIKAGENFHFAKAGKHGLKADEKFKMALLITLE